MDAMPSIIVKLNHTVIRQMQLPQGDLSIGRRPGHALVLEDAAVSADHASIFTVGQDSFLKDLESTNGTYINNRRTNKHHLKPGDTIMIGKYTLLYQDRDIGPVQTPQPAALEDAALFVLSGFNSGKRIELMSTITHLGMAGQSAALLSRTGDRYTLMMGPDGARVICNNKPVPPGGQVLVSGDIIEVGDTRLQFYQH
ncbi:FHA domain-containing protein [Acidiferrobacter sp.]|uniref:FHA domain-containing protein n=1 Tax=Acidiferrobacter sp. TaxID=1872107 RepID=UPI0026385ABC|nr:FHA domain-containing protein [Acidiferrobacter sp.]